MFGPASSETRVLRDLNPILLQFHTSGMRVALGEALANRGAAALAVEEAEVVVVTVEKP